MGAWFLYGLGTENQNLPGYVVLCPGRPVRFSILWNSAFLPSAYQGTYINHSTIEPGKMAAWIAPPGRGINNLPVEYEYVKLH